MKNNIIFNPFIKIAGIQSLIIGFLAMIISGIIGYFSNTHYDGVLNIHSGFEASLWMHLCEPFINWAYLSTWFYIIALIFGQSNIRAIDIFGTQAFALIPLLPGSFSGFFKVIERLSQQLIGMNPSNLNEITFTSEMFPVLDLFNVAIIGLFVLLFTVWSGIWMYNGFKISSNLPNKIVIPSYVFGILSGMFIPKIIINLLV